jgi:hypothetical protein
MLAQKELTVARQAESEYPPGEGESSAGFFVIRTIAFARRSSANPAYAAPIKSISGTN